MAKEFISIQEAAELSNKSVQTIRRAIKAKKLNSKGKKLLKDSIIGLAEVL